MKERSPLSSARIAGLLALTVLITGSFAGYVHTKLVVPTDAATTTKNIMASEFLFRLGILSGLTMYTVFIFYVLQLYKLLKPVDKNHALIMLALGLVGVPIAMLNQVNQYTALLVLNGADHLNLTEQIESQVMLFLKLHAFGNLIAVIFWGLWLFPLGLLVFKSGYFPKFLGILLMIGCFGWLILFFQRLLFPNYEALAYSRFAAHIAELSWMLWLLIKGINVEKWEKRTLEFA